MSEVPQVRPERSLAELFGELTREINTLIRQELALFKTEIGKKAADVGKNVGMLVAGGAVAYAGLLALLAAVILLLAQAMPAWVAALIVGLVVAGGGGFLVYNGLEALKKEDLTPRETVETLKEDASWARQQTRQRG